VANKIAKTKIDALYRALGRFILTWAEVELYLDLLVLVLRDGEKTLPHTLGSKIKFARKNLQPLKSSHAKVSLRLIGEIEQLANTRHDYIHGARIGFVLSRSELSVTLGRFLQPPSLPRRTPIKVTAANIEETSNRLYAIGGELLDALDGFNRH
jgi:hypothetical protein